MEKFIIEDWNSGFKLINLPSSVKYVELYDANNVIMNDNYVFTIDVVNVVSLDYENFEGAAFPLQLYAFDKDEMDSGEPLFDLTSGGQSAQSRLAIGKRHELAKNVTSEDLFDYINDYGFAYVTKNFDGLNFSTARTNLDVYTTSEVDEKLRGISNKATNIKISDTFPLRPFYSHYKNTVSLGNFGSYFESGTMHVLLSLRAQYILNGENFETNLKIFKICSSTEVVGNSFTPMTLVIALPFITSLPQLPNSANYYWDLPEISPNAITHTVDSLLANLDKTSNLPILIMTPNAETNFCGTTLEANSIYFYRNSIAPRPGIPGIASFLKFDYPIDVNYELIYYPGDFQ